MASRRSAPRRQTRKDFERCEWRLCELQMNIKRAIYDFFYHPECQAKITEALQEMREIVGADKSEPARALYALALVEKSLSRKETLLQESLKLFKETPTVYWGPKHRDQIAYAELDIGRLMTTSNRLAEGEALMRDCVKREKSCSLQCQALSLLSDILCRSGKLEEAEKCALSALKLAVKLPSSSDEDSQENAEILIAQHSILGNIYEEMGCYEDSHCEEDAVYWEKMCHHDTRVIELAMESSETTFSVVVGVAADTIRRLLDLLLQRGALEDYKSDHEDALEFAEYLVEAYKEMIEVDGDLSANQYQTLKYIEGLRVYASVLEKLGRVEEAEAWEMDLNETEDIILTLQQAALEELREEMAREREEAKRNQQQGPKKLTRKQKKRKAAATKRKKEQEERQQQQGYMPGMAAAAAPEAAAPSVMDAAAAMASLTMEGEEESVVAAAGQYKEEEREQGKNEGIEEEEEEDAEEEEEEEQECSVCLGEIGAGAMGSDSEGAVLLVCTHVFHGACLKRWEEMCKVKEFPRSCPMCRSAIIVATDDKEAGEAGRRGSK